MVVMRMMQMQLIALSASCFRSKVVHDKYLGLWKHENYEAELRDFVGHLLLSLYFLSSQTCFSKSYLIRDLIRSFVRDYSLERSIHLMGQRHALLDRRLGFRLPTRLSLSLRRIG